MAAAAVASARGLPVEVRTQMLGMARPAYPAAATVHSDGRVSMQLATRPHVSPIRSVAPSGTQSSPSPNDAQPTASMKNVSYSIPRKVPPHEGGRTASVEGVPEQAVSYTIPRKEAPQRAVGGPSINRIPLKTKPTCYESRLERGISSVRNECKWIVAKPASTCCFALFIFPTKST